MNMRAILERSVNLIPLRVRQLIRHLPVIANFQRWIVSSVLAGRPFIHLINAGPARGLRFEVTLPLDKAVWAGIYETAFAEAIGRGVSQGAVCYDVGGYRGYMAGVMAIRGAAKVVVFEPLPANQEALRRLCELNPSLPIEIQALAAGLEDTESSLKVMADTSMSKLTSSRFQTEAASVGEISVQVRRIDSLIASSSLTAPTLMKIDVEGSEMDVLHGAENTLARARPRLFIETHSAELSQKCTVFLNRLSYVVRQLEVGELSVRQTRHLIAWPE